MRLYTESVTWLGWRQPATKLEATGFGQFAVERRAATGNYQVLQDRAIHALRGHRFERFQLFGYSRLDDFEFLEIQTFLEMLVEMQVMPKEKRISKPAPDFQNMVHCWFHEPSSGPGQGRHFATLQADIYDLNGAIELRDAFSQLRGVQKFI